MVSVLGEGEYRKEREEEIDPRHVTVERSILMVHFG